MDRVEGKNLAAAADLLRHSTAKLSAAQLHALLLRMRNLRESGAVIPGHEALFAGCAQALREEDLAVIPDGAAVALKAGQPAEISHPGAWQFPYGIGLALADRTSGGDRITLCFLPEEGDLAGSTHESMVLAARESLPLLIVLPEDQRPARANSPARGAQLRPRERGRGWGIREERIDGSDPIALAHATTRALRRLRAGDGPVLLVGETFRQDRPFEALDGNSMNPSQIEYWRRRDPLARLEAYLDRHRLAEPLLQRGEA